jgi:excisionase family DNA binding protein
MRAGPSASVSRQPGPLWTVEQVAQRCSVSPRTTRRWIKAGALRAYRLGSLVRVSEEDFAAFLAAHREP